MPIAMLLGASLLALLIGIASGYYLRRLYALGQKASLELDLKEKLLKADEQALKIIEKAETKADRLESEAKADHKEREDKLKHKEERLEKKEELLDERQISLDSEKESIRSKIEKSKHSSCALMNAKMKLITSLKRSLN